MSSHRFAPPWIVRALIQWRLAKNEKTACYFLVGFSCLSLAGSFIIFSHGVFVAGPTMSASYNLPPYVISELPPTVQQRIQNANEK